jgi:hypothetical protein
VKSQNQFRPVDFFVWGAALLMLAHASIGGAQVAVSTPQATFESECAACHVGYPARLLRPAEWAMVLGALDRHYGVDASLDQAALAAVATYLGASPRATGAGSGGKAASPLPRITTSAWFREEHDEVPGRVWASPAVKTAANCSACHVGAERGNFAEDSVRLPK